MTRRAALVCTHVTRLVSERQCERALSSRCSLQAMSARERERDRERVGEIDRESRKATLLPHFRLREHEGLQSNRPHITCKLRQLFCTSLSAWPAHNVTCDQVKCQVTFKSSFRTVANCINCPQWERQRERERESRLHKC